MALSQVIAEPSRAALHDEVQRRIEKGCRCLSSAVIDKMRYLRSIRKKLGQEHPEKTYKEIADQDLCQAAFNGTCTEFHPLEGSSAGWRLAIRGSDTEGDDLVVMVKLLFDDDALVEIEDFVMIQP